VHALAFSGNYASPWDPREAHTHLYIGQIKGSLACVDKMTQKVGGGIICHDSFIVS